MSDDKSLYFHYTREFWNGTAMKLLGSLHPGLLLEPEPGPLEQSSHAGVAVEKLSYRSCLVFVI